jgi:hypothetical protein
MWILLEGKTAVSAKPKAALNVKKLVKYVFDFSEILMKNLTVFMVSHFSGDIGLRVVARFEGGETAVLGSIELFDRNGLAPAGSSSCEKNSLGCGQRPRRTCLSIRTHRRKRPLVGCTERCGKRPFVVGRLVQFDNALCRCIQAKLDQSWRNGRLPS